jgi:DNA adenine methylase
MSRYLTPLRYPGGKQRLTPFVLELLKANKMIGGHYVEPYAGGAGVGVELLLKGHVSHIHLNDSAFPIYAFWRSIISNPEEFCRRISSAFLDVEEWKRQRKIIGQPLEHSELEIGFSAFYLNRCNRSGILSGGLIGGVSQAGDWKMDARFPVNELIRRIEAIASRSQSITVQNWDAEKFIIEHIPTLPVNTFVYCDPPYLEKSRRLYLDRYERQDHAHIAQVIQTQLARKWIVSYDACAEVLSYYRDRKCITYSMQYNASRVYKGSEVFSFLMTLHSPHIPSSHILT